MVAYYAYGPEQEVNEGSDHSAEVNRMLKVVKLCHVMRGR